MKNLFTYKSYRQYLSDLCTSKEVRRGFQTQLARAAGCQAAYFSQVLRERVHLTEDQILALSEELQLSSTEINFLILLLRFEKAGTEKLKKFLMREMERARAEQNQLSTRVLADRVIHSEEDLGKYFSSWIPSAIHVITSSKNYQTIDNISDRLHLSKDQVKEILVFLTEKGWIKKTGQEFQYASGNIHIPKESPLHSTMQMTRRHVAMNSIIQNFPESVHYSSVFTLDPESYEKLKDTTLSFVQRSAKQINSGGTDELYTLALDLFRVP